MLEVRQAIRSCDLSRLRDGAPRLLRARDREGIERWLGTTCIDPATGAPAGSRPRARGR
jgi:phosphotransferase system enzyme I (PtsI)